MSEKTFEQTRKLKKENKVLKKKIEEYRETLVRLARILNELLSEDKKKLIEEIKLDYSSVYNDYLEYMKQVIERLEKVKNENKEEGENNENCKID